MIVLDTNVLSEPLKQRPELRVLDWLSSTTETATTAVCAGELLVGVTKLPRGRRRDRLDAAVVRLLETHRDSVLPYDSAAARQYAVVRELRRSAGQPLSAEDGMIAAICLSLDVALATRNIRDFEGLGLTLINPWTD